METLRHLVRSARHLAVALAIGFLLAAAAAPASAQAYVDTEALDDLFAELRVAPDAASAQRLDQQIWSLWMSPNDPGLAGRMNEVLKARTEGNPLATIELLNLLVRDYPDYAEGWNQRATMFYLIGNFEASIADCARVLELEPRHFGALSGRALMHLQLGNRPLALKDMTTALEIHPFLNERQLFPELQQEITRI
jgi:tetratricopeptide (TPR) repeat protein